jgi:hypothetical protein
MALALALATACAGGCHASHGRDEARADAAPPRADAAPPRADAAPRLDAGSDGGPRREPRLVWVLVHPSDAPRGPGLHLFDEASQEVLRRLPLPDGVTSPHALAWDGASLWLGGAGSDDAVREIDPEDGRVRSTWPGVRTEGIATRDGRYWYHAISGRLEPLVEVGRDGAVVRSFGLREAVVQDLVATDAALYYLVNDGLDRIGRFDLATGAATELARGVDVAPYALGFDGTHLVVAARGIARRFDPRTGELVRESPFAVPGWITAIAYVR